MTASNPRRGGLDSWWNTCAAATTLTPQVVQQIGYSRRAAFKEAAVHTAIGEEHGYGLHVAEFTGARVTTPNFALTVFPPGHKDIDGLVGMNFLRHFNFEIRPGRAHDPPVTDHNAS